MQYSLFCIVLLDFLNISWIFYILPSPTQNSIIRGISEIYSMAKKWKPTFAYLLRSDHYLHQRVPLDYECLMHWSNKKGFSWGKTWEGKRWSLASNTQSLLEADLKAYCFSRVGAGGGTTVWKGLHHYKITLVTNIIISNRSLWGNLHISTLVICMNLLEQGCPILLLEG